MVLNINAFGITDIRFAWTFKWYFMQMANPKRSRPENTAGDFYVDDTCIDCDTCRWLAPATFLRAGEFSAVGRQPATSTERELALQAAVACPTASIGTHSPASELPSIRRAFPLPLEDNVFYCGYHSRKSFGAASYFIQRDEGNILVDSPRFSPVLAERLESMGGVRYFYLTHGDDVADHEAWRDRFGCERIMHKWDANVETLGLEILLQDEQPYALAEDLLILPVPGHTRGSTVLLYRDKFIFTGDHLAYSIRLKHLYAFRTACWYSWEKQILSMETLLKYRFEWVLPGHGRRYHANAEEISRQMGLCIEWMKSR